MKLKMGYLKLSKFFNLEALQKSTIFFVTIGIFILVNLIAGYASWRVDLTKTKMHTLSPQTKKIVRRLDDIATIKFFLSSDLPNRLLSLKTEIVDLINEYKKLGRGKIIVKIIDPKKDPDAKSEAESVGVPELQFSQVEKDKYAVSSTYFGMAISYGVKTEVIPQATNIGSLEYDLTSAIFKLTQKTPIKVGLAGVSEFLPREEDVFATTKKILSQQFELEFIDASASAKDKGIDPTMKTMIVVDDGKTKYDVAETAMLQKYLSGKGKMIFILDGVSVREDTFSSVPASHNLFDFFETYGVKLNRNYVLSESSEMASFTSGELGFITPYPFWVKTSNFDSKAVEFAHIGQLVFPWVASVEIKKKSGIQASAFVSSEPSSWTVPDTTSLSPQTITAPNKSEMKKQLLIVEVKNKGGGGFVLIPSSRFINERFIDRAPENIDVFINMVNNYASDGLLSGIRSRSITQTPLANLSEKTKDVVKYLMILLLPIIFAIFGAARLIKRR